MKNNSILLVEDDNWLREGLSHFLQQSGFTVMAVANLCSARNVIIQNEPTSIDIILCDVGLPDGSGLNLFEELHQNNNPSGKIFISANSSEQARIQGLKTGADDYICKPINPDELLLRIQALLRRMQPRKEPSSELLFLNYRLNLESRELKQDQYSCQLSTNEHQLLLQFIAQQGKIVSRYKLTQALDIDTCDKEGRALDILVSRLRKKMQLTIKNPSPIVTYRGRGYMLLAKT
ncbi:response regulator transcription factor [Shewanella algidipiscicola]|uniref:response regulator transcription factor n=1 Tax=Shewanella algidipiscicola TaxID=614070 RepID=UPI000D7881F2|nr:response regulator transcription factor [Shewanella algidipiscicola]